MEITKEAQPHTRILVDVTCFDQVAFLSGIQRVVRGVLEPWIESRPQELVLIAWNFATRRFDIIDNQAFYDYYRGKSKNRDYMTRQHLEVEDIGTGYTLYEIDSTWCNAMRRTFLLPRIKGQGAKVVVFVHDILPITQSEYCDEENTPGFVECLCAQIKYADRIITSTEATAVQIRDLCQGTDVTPASFFTAPLGSDFEKGVAMSQSDIRPHVLSMASQTPYILMVGTMEPRKNHAYVLDAFEQADAEGKTLFDKGYTLIMAGRPGWNIDAFMERIQSHPQYGKHFFQPQGLSDQEITYLYEHAHAVGFTSFGEGFGLPIVEAFQRGVPIISSDIPVLREVGGDFSLYCDLEDPSTFVARVEELADADFYKEIKDKIATYVPRTWKQVAEEMYQAIVSVAGE